VREFQNMTCPVWINPKSWIKTVELPKVKSHLKMALNLKDNGSMDSETVKESKNGQMVQDMTAHGVTIKPMAKVNLSMLMEISTKDGG